MSDSHTEPDDSSPKSAAKKVGENLSQTGLGRSIAGGIRGEQVTSQGVLEALGGVRGITETLLPGVLYLVTFVITQDARISVIAPALLAIIAVAVRLFMKQSVITAFSGAFGVGVCVVTTLVTGRGEDYFLPGFWINGAWITALVISLAARRPLLGYLIGFVRGNFGGWRSDPHVRRLATIATSVWAAMFGLRLIVQIPLYLAEEVAWLGIARLVMGVPLFALVILFTWLLLRKTLAAEIRTEK